VIVNDLRTEAELENFLAEPSELDCDAVAKLGGDLLLLGAGGKMGPSLARRARRAVQRTGSRIRVIAVARFQTPGLKQALAADGIETIAADLLDRKQIDALPDAANVVFMAGRKFGSTGSEALTWAINAYAPALAAERYRSSRIVAFSTGNVYPFVPADSGGATEDTPPAPIGEYGQSALARERIFEYFSTAFGIPIALLRLTYAVELRYGVLLDIGRRVFERRPVSLVTGAVNFIWQGEANSICLRAFGLCQSPALVLNLTGAGTVSVRELARQFGLHFGIEPIFEGVEAPTALLNNASKCHRLLGSPAVPPEQMITWVARWIAAAGPTLDKPTHFEVRDGGF